MSTNNNTNNEETIGGSTSTTTTQGNDAPLISSPGVTSSSLHNSATTTTYVTPRGDGGQGSFGSNNAYQTPNTSGQLSTTSPGGGGRGGIIGGSARGDRRSRLVRDRSRSSATFASPGLVKMAKTSVRTCNNNNMSLSSSAAKQQQKVLPTAAELENDTKDKIIATQDESTTKPLQNIKEEEISIQEESALFTSFCYKGMEVIFTAINNNNNSSQSSTTKHGTQNNNNKKKNNEQQQEGERPSCHLLGIHSRTRVPFQKLFINTPPLPTSSQQQQQKIVQLTSHPSTGQMYISTNYGYIYSFYPIVADPMKYAYGKYRWVLGCVANVREVFGYPPLLLSSSSKSKRNNLEEEGSNKEEEEVLSPLSLQSSEDGVEVLSDTLLSSSSSSNNNNQRMVVSSNNKEGAGQEAVCFHRRRNGQTTSAVAPGSLNLNFSNSPTKKALQNNYPLTTDGQPPLPTTMLMEDSTTTDDGGSGLENEEEHGIMICASMTSKRVLIVHRDQIAIYDFSLPPLEEEDVGSSATNIKHNHYNNNEQQQQQPAEAFLLWTHTFQGSIVDHASISGDGCAIALSLRGEGVGVPYPFGVRTFVRDKDDGSGVVVVAGGQKKDANNTNSKASAVDGGGGGKSPMKSGGGGKPPIHRRTGSGVQSLGVHQSPPLPTRKQGNYFDAAAVVGEETTPSAKANAPNNIPSSNINNSRSSSSGKQGILYKPAQFLVHSAPVTRLAFRGYGTITSSASHNSTSYNEDEEGNDLLLTTCSSDCSVRIFSQNSWRQLMHWNSPPRSRADWVRGISAANLGDLDSSPTSSGNSSHNNNSNTTSSSGKDSGQLTPIPKDVMDSSPNLQHQQHASSASLDNASTASDTSGGINRVLLANTHNHRGVPPPTSSLSSHSVPGTHAGAWIAELTFRNTFPALRLSRLSYMKTGGDDALPAHFESVAAILPPGSIDENAVLDNDDGEGGGRVGECRMEVEGIWPIWDPWEPDLKGKGRSSSVGYSSVGSGDAGNGKEQSPVKSGSAGSNPSPIGSPTPTASMAPKWLGDGSDLGGSHMPPSELRLTTSHSCYDNNLTQIEMPLWGDKDFGAMEFGAPMRYVMMMPEEEKKVHTATLPEACLEYESGSRLCAQSSLDRRSIDLCWRKHGAVNLEEVTLKGGIDVVTPVRSFKDLSLIPLPLSLPSLTLPGQPQSSSTTIFDKHAVASLHWWPDENYGGPPRLVAITAGGTLIVYEMPPPWSALEPPMPAYDPFNDEDDDMSRGSSIDSDYLSDGEGGVLMDENAIDAESFTTRSSGRAEYEVSILPHPDFGLGLRLESAVMEGMPAIAGSFKKHPLSGGRLPAERSGVIVLGDELLAVNDISLEGMKFEEAIGTVRQIGFDSYGAPLNMRFRRGRKRKSSTLGSSGGGSGGRIKLNTSVDSKASANIAEQGTNKKSGGSIATVEVGADSEIQQGFGRIIAIVRDAMIVNKDSSSSPPMLLLPWNFGKGATVSPKMYGGALILWAVPGPQRVIKAARLEAVLDIDPENARFEELGSISLDNDGVVSSVKPTMIKSISHISSTEKGWLVAIHDCGGNVSLLFIETTSSPSNDSPTGSTICASFRHYPCIFNSYGITACEGKKHDPRDAFTLKSFSLELFGCMKQCEEGCKELTIWSALPQSMHGNNDGGSTQPSLEYNNESICIDDIILDFEWVSSGFVDAFPWLIIFTESEARVYHRSAIQATWQTIAVFSYKEKLYRTGMGSINPRDAFPHLITALRCIILPNDEQNKAMKCDWHPESILASICTEEEGAQLALKSYVRGLYLWLSQWMNSDESMRPSWDDCYGPLPNAPFRIVNDKTVLIVEKEENNDSPVETSANLFATMSLSNTTNATPKPKSEEEVLLDELQTSLFMRNNAPDNNLPTETLNGTHHRSREFILAMSYGQSKAVEENSNTPLPTPLQNLNSDELRCIWAIGDVMFKDPPSFTKLDSQSQLCLFCISLMRRLLKSKNVTTKASIEPINSMPSYEGGRPMFAKPSSSDNDGKFKFDTVASAAILSALMSDNQVKLIDRCRISKGEKFSWETARSVGIPYWVRSSKYLASIAEEIAQTVYKSSKSVMDCALYYIAMRNMKKLRAIAATDRSQQGQKFLKFIIDHDFSSERGRNAAEKNAYSLLRKRKYVSAASFFLLAEPPMIKTALDVIKLQLKDFSLAFFVARLMENAPKSSNTSVGSLTIGGGFNLSSMGGGGGFAGNVTGGSSLSDEAEDETIQFDSWEPKLGKSARSVLLAKDPPGDQRDICFESLQLLWLNRPNEAKLRLSYMPASDKLSGMVGDVLFPCSFATEETVLKKANEVINFCACPTLLKRMRPKKRVLWTSALLVSRALSRCGIEIPSMRILLLADPDYQDDYCSKKRVDQAAKKPNGTSSSSSIFDSYDVAPPNPMTAPQKQPVTNAMPSSIFDSFDAAPPKKPLAPIKPPQTDLMSSSSIFDSFDAAPPKPKSVPKPPQTDPMSSSSIFDSFDAAPPKPKSVPKPPPMDPMSSSSSIFDSFDAAPPRPKQAAIKPPPQTKPTPSSSIFDSFDTAPQKRKQQALARPTPKANADLEANEIEKEQPFDIPNCPTLWDEWRERLIHTVAARRFVRELARIISSFGGEPSYATMGDFAQRDYPLIQTASAEVLHNACDSERLLSSILKSLTELGTAFGINETVILEQTLELLSSRNHPKRIVFSVIIQSILERGDLAEDLVRDAASFQVNSSEFVGFSNDTILDNRETRYYTSSLWARRDSSSMIWQLELCLWLNRGGAFDMSAIASKETLLAVRVGLAVAAWGRCHHTLDTLIKAEPDCPVDFDLGKNLWRSMKIIVVNESVVDGIDGVTSGGWEFLVDCRREEATEMLRDGKTGQFLIRPHPQDPGVFTLSFKTNLIPTEPAPTTNYDEAGNIDKPQETPAATSATPKKVVKRDDVVQHAIVRLTDSGFRCGSFGPFATLVKLLHAVSDSLPFDLRFSDPPIKGIISEKGIQTSPNSFLFRKSALHSKAQFYQFESSKNIAVADVDDCILVDDEDTVRNERRRKEADIHRRFGLFTQLMFLTEIRKQLCAVAAAVENEDANVIAHDKQVKSFPEIDIDIDFDGSLSEGSLEADDENEEAFGVAFRMVKPLLNWVRSMEIDIVDEVAPLITHYESTPSSNAETSVATNASGDKFEVPSRKATRGDSMIRRMIQAGSGVDFRTLRVGEAGNSVIVVLFDKHDAIKWLMANETGNDEVEAAERLKLMELMRVIEPITSTDLSIPKSYAASHPSTESRYRFVDPWEVEALESRSGETASAALGRGRYQALGLGLIASSSEKIVRAAGGLHLLGLWSTMKGGITLTKALCSAHPSWERDAGGDLLMKKGFLMEPSPYDNSIRQHLYGNHLFRRLGLPQRFLALVQVELLDLKNVTSPSGTSSLTAYALLRLKRQGSSAPLNHKARSLDSACTQARKISKSSGPNAPASWGSLVRFRFPLPEDVNCEGKSFDTDRESLFKVRCFMLSIPL